MLQLPSELKKYLLELWALDSKADPVIANKKLLTH
jgi:hypothetical protein